MRINLYMPTLLMAGSLTLNCATTPSSEDSAQPLFDTPGVPQGWTVRAWDDVSKPGPDGAAWRVDDDGILHGSEPRGTWLVSEREYGDFTLKFEWKLGDRGNSGCAIRFPLAGDPAFDGLEIQMVDERYNDGKDGPDRLTASIYKAIAADAQVFKPNDWNAYKITARGDSLTVILNGTVVQKLDLNRFTNPVVRHDGTLAAPLKDRPRRGHIGFQELSRGGAHVMIRNARIRMLDEAGM